MRISAQSIPGAFSAGQLAEFVCSSSGSRPPAKLSWLKNNQPLKAELWRQIDSPPSQPDSSVVAAGGEAGTGSGGGGSSHSKLTLKLERQDHGAKLSCRAENEHLAKLLYSSSSSALDSMNSSSEEFASRRILEDTRTLVVNCKLTRPTFFASRERIKYQY